MEYIWELFINLLGTSLFFIFANGKLDRKEIRYIYAKQTIACIIISIVLWIMNIYNMPTILTILFVLILFHYIYVEIFFSASHIEKFFWVTVFAMTSIFAEALTTIIPTQLFHIDLSEELMGGTLRIPFTLLYMLLIAVFVITLLCFSSRTFKLNFIEKISFIFISVLCIIIENLIVVTQTVKYKSHIRLLTNTLYMVFFLVLALFVALTIYVYQLGIQRERFLQLSKEQIISDMENKQYEQIISSIAELRYLKHDIYNHLNALNTLLSNQDYIEAQHYIHELSDSIESDHYILTSGNSTMDSILTNKFIQCKSSGIKVNYSVFLPECIPLSNIEICSIIGNLFDNAIEACCKIPVESGGRQIVFSMQIARKMLHISCKNALDEPPRKQNDRFLTDKPGEGHGYGIESIRSAVQKADGRVDFSCAEGFFFVSVLLELRQCCATPGLVDTKK